MRKNKTHKKLIKEAVSRELIWRKFQKSYYPKVIMLERKGYPKDLISEALYIDAIKGFIKALIGDQAASASGVDAGPDGLRLILKEQALQYLLKKIGIDPDTAKGAMIRNGIEERLKTMTDEDFKALLKGGQACKPVALKIGDILGVAVKDGLKEQLFTKVVNSVFEDFSDAKNNILFGGLFITMREKFSDAMEAPLNDAIDQFFDSGEFMEKAAEMVCDMSLVDMVKDVNPSFMSDVGRFLTGQSSDFLRYIMGE